MIKPLVFYKDPILHKKLKPVKDLGGETAQLAADMLDTCTVYQGVGLAANQIGVDAQLFITRYYPKFPQVYVNPEISIPPHTYREQGVEACLSRPGVFVNKFRYKKVLITCDSVTGNKPGRETITLQNRDARIAQHEMDHLNGIVCWDGEEETRA